MNNKNVNEKRIGSFLCYLHGTQIDSEVRLKGSDAAYILCVVCSVWFDVAPSIYENMDIKKGILLQLFSGSQKDFDNSSRGKFRSDSHNVIGLSSIRLLSVLWSYL